MKGEEGRIGEKRGMKGQREKRDRTGKKRMEMSGRKGGGGVTKAF